ncbi:MAG: carboxylesterase family protein [Lachnospiraceae bacterium]|nr:carboxylesterase family protein [Lachnospiraceae bacterium]
MFRRVLFGLLVVLFLAVLELNKNRLWSFAVFLLITVLYIVWRETALKGAAFLPRAGAFLLWLGAFAAVVLLSWPPVKRVPAVTAKDPVPTGVVTLKKGQVQGVYNEDGSVAVYAGIPYAAPPVGDLRWKEPQDPAPWDGILQADRFAPMSMQPVNLPIYDSLTRLIGYHDYKIHFGDESRPPVSEDSLYVNVWQPAGAREGDALPVLVFIHGGSLQTGQPWYRDYNGESLAKEGVIVVNMGYRLGVFGYLALDELAAETPDGTTGNYGLLDQIKALEWVRDNIAAFGGDPGQVTLAGESAGAAAVSAICASPLAKGLFQRAVLESSTIVSPDPPHSFRTREEALESGAEVKEKLQTLTLDALRALPAEKLVAFTETEHHMTVDGYALRELPYETYRAGRMNETAVLQGFNQDESAPFIMFAHANKSNFESRVRKLFKEYADEVLALYPVQTDAEAKQAWADIFSVVYFDYPHFCLSHLAGERGIPAWTYYFTRANGSLSSWHSGEMIYLYGNIPVDSRLYDARDRALSREMFSYLLNFVKTGDPNGTDPAGAALPAWEADPAGLRVLEWGAETVMRDIPYRELFAILDRMQGF